MLWEARTVTVSGLLEREKELRAVHAVVARAQRRDGCLCTVRGPAGIGKTALLEAACTKAARRPLNVLRARCTPMERETPYGVVRQLFEAMVINCAGAISGAFAGLAGLAAPVFGFPVPEGLLPPTDPEQASLIGLYWILANAASANGALVAVDDVQWADASSTRWLSYVARRIDEPGVAVLLTNRGSTGDAAAGPDVDLGDHLELTPEPLSEDAVSRLVAAGLGRTPDRAFAMACAHATGGNPFLVKELIRGLQATGTPPDASAVAAVSDLTTERLHARMIARLDRIGPAARPLAEGAMILGAGGTLADAAALAELDLDIAAAAADGLRADDMLQAGEGLAFSHPIVATTIEQGILPGRRAMLHDRAARLLDQRHAPVERVAAHLLLTEPRGQDWVVERLRHAAGAAMRRGAPRDAIPLLDRAREEGVPSSAAEVLFELGEAEGRVADPAAAPHLQAALALSNSDEQRARIKRELGRVLTMAGMAKDAMDLLDLAVEETVATDPDAALRLEATLLAGCRLHPDVAHRSSDRLRDRDDAEPCGDTPGQRAILACLAAEAVAEPGRAATARERATRALGDGALLTDEGCEAPIFYLACAALTWSDAPTTASEHLEQACEIARASGSTTGYAHACAWRAEAMMRAGAVREVEADARSALDAIATSGAPGLPQPLSIAWLSWALVEQARLREAHDVLASAGYLNELPPFAPWSTVAFARGMLRVAQCDFAPAAADFELAGVLLTAAAVDGPGVLPWRSAAAHARAALGDLDKAREHAERELALARTFGATRSIGLALLALARVQTPEDALDTLREAVSALGQSHDQLEHARALHHLGRALRHAREQRAARDPLREALDLTVRVGAGALADSIHAELLATGARPRRRLLTGRDALTPAELRVAQLAAGGLSNREMAQTLFVTTGTVETQLHQVFRKLGIHSRREITEALDVAPVTEPVDQVGR